MSTAILEQARAVELEQHEANRKAWASLIIDATDGRKRPGSEIADILRQCGKTATDLESAVDALRKRRQWQEAYRNGEAAKQERQSVDSEFRKDRDTLQEQLKAIQEKISERTREYRVTSLRLDDRISAGDSARLNLLNHQTPEAIQEQGPLFAERDRLMQELERLRADRAGSSMFGGLLKGRSYEAFKQEENALEAKLKSISERICEIELKGFLQ